MPQGCQVCLGMNCRHWLLQRIHKADLMSLDKANNKINCWNGEIDFPKNVLWCFLKDVDRSAFPCNLTKFLEMALNENQCYFLTVRLKRNREPYVFTTRWILSFLQRQIQQETIFFLARSLWNTVSQLANMTMFHFVWKRDIDARVYCVLCNVYVLDNFLVTVTYF